MDWFIVVVGLLLLVVATPIALAWWKLARKVVPYGDEGAKKTVKAGDESEVIILPSNGPKRGG